MAYKTQWKFFLTEYVNSILKTTYLNGQIIFLKRLNDILFISPVHIFVRLIVKTYLIYARHFFTIYRLI